MSNGLWPRRQAPRASLVAALLIVCGVEGGVLKLSGRVEAVDGVPLPGYVEVMTGPGGHVRGGGHWTDSEGRFSIEVPAADRLVVVARAEGYVSEEHEVVAGDREEIRLGFALFPAGQVVGRVLDDVGRAVAGALVRVRYPGEIRRVVYGQEEGNVHSDDFGYFRLPFVARGQPFVIEAVTEDRLPAFSDAATIIEPSMAEIVVRLERPGERVRVRVLGPGGEPVPGAVVRLRASADGEEFDSEQRRSRSFLEVGFLLESRRRRNGIVALRPLTGAARPPAAGSFECRGG
jgi:hypothetical protein